MTTTKIESFFTRLGWVSLVRNEEGALKELRLVEEPSQKEDPVLSPLAQRMKRHLWGEVQDFSDVELDLTSITPFAQKVYAEARRIAPGHVKSYGDLAKALGSPGAARAVGTALGRNPFLIVVPCHRVLGSQGAWGGFSAPGGIRTKSLLLAAEGYGTESMWDKGQLQQGLELLRNDAMLKPLIEGLPPYPAEPRYPKAPFAALARGVLYQQISTGAARSIEERVRLLGSAPFPTADEVLNLKDEAFRQAGLSGPKVSALKALATATVSGQLLVDELHLLPDEVVTEEVCRIKGLGSWTAEMFLFFHLGRRDLLPVKDLGVRKGFKLVFGLEDLPSPRLMTHKAKAWRPYRSLASWYFWRVLG